MSRGRRTRNAQLRSTSTCGSSTVRQPKSLRAKLIMRIARLRIKAVLKYDEKRKYFLQLPRGDIEELPPQFINVVRVRGAIQFTTVELKKMNNLIVDASHEAAMRSKDVIRDLLGEIRLHIQDLLRVCESIAQIDMIVSFAQVSIAHGYVRPGLASTLALKSARHPILDQVCGFT